MAISRPDEKTNNPKPVKKDMPLSFWEKFDREKLLDGSVEGTVKEKTNTCAPCLPCVIL